MIVITRTWLQLDTLLNFLVRRSEKKGLKRTLILSDILETGQSTATLYRRVAQLVRSRGIDKLIGVGAEISSCTARFDDALERISSRIQKLFWLRIC